MGVELLEHQVQEKLSAMGGAEIIVGIPSYNNADTIGQVVRVALEGLQKYFPARRALIVNSDGGSKDRTVQAIDPAHLNTPMILSVSHPLYPMHHLTTPYHGLPGRGSAYQTLLHIAELAQAQALALVDADLRSLTPEWFDLLLRPVREQVLAPAQQMVANAENLNTVYNKQVAQPVQSVLDQRAQIRAEILKKAGALPG